MARRKPTKQRSTKGKNHGQKKSSRSNRKGNTRPPRGKQSNGKRGKRSASRPHSRETPSRRVRPSVSKASGSKRKQTKETRLQRRVRDLEQKLRHRDRTIRDLTETPTRRRQAIRFEEGGVSSGFEPGGTGSSAGSSGAGAFEVFEPGLERGSSSDWEPDFDWDDLIDDVGDEDEDSYGEDST